MSRNGDAGDNRTGLRNVDSRYIKRPQIGRSSQPQFLAGRHVVARSDDNRFRIDDDISGNCRRTGELNFINAA